MKQVVKGLIKQTWLGHKIEQYLAKTREAKRLKERQARELAEWETAGRPAPPPHIVKQRNLKAFAQKYDLRVLVETGTYMGEMIAAMKGSFRQIYTIELDHKLARDAQTAFQSDKHIEVIQGDSGVEIATVLKRLNQPALFWLDGHYSGGVTARGSQDTPIYEELRQILNAPEKRHVILIDDARLFKSDPGYPDLEDLLEFIRTQRADLQITIEDDSIRLEPA